MVHKIEYHWSSIPEDGKMNVNVPSLESLVHKLERGERLTVAEAERVWLHRDTLGYLAWSRPARQRLFQAARSAGVFRG